MSTLKIQKSNLKTQNDKEKFKENFTKRLINLAVRGLKFAEKLRQNRNLWVVADQFSDSLTSIGANVIEAKSASSKRDYIHFFKISLKSANETKFWLLIIKEYSPELNSDAQLILNEVTEVANIIGSSILTLKGKK